MKTNKNNNPANPPQLKLGDPDAHEESSVPTPTSREASLTQTSPQPQQLEAPRPQEWTTSTPLRLEEASSHPSNPFTHFHPFPPHFGFSAQEVGGVSQGYHKPAIPEASLSSGTHYLATPPNPQARLQTTGAKRRPATGAKLQEPNRDQPPVDGLIGTSPAQPAHSHLPSLLIPSPYHPHLHPPPTLLVSAQAVGVPQGSHKPVTTEGILFCETCSPAPTPALLSREFTPSTAAGEQLHQHEPRTTFLTSHPITSFPQTPPFAVSGQVKVGVSQGPLKPATRAQSILCGTDPSTPESPLPTTRSNRAEPHLNPLSLLPSTNPPENKKPQKTQKQEGKRRHKRIFIGETCGGQTRTLGGSRNKRG